MVHSLYEPQIGDVRREYARWLQSVFGSSERLMLGTYTFRNPDIKYGQWTVPGRQYVSRAGQRLHDLLLAHGSSAIVCVEEGTDTRRLHLHSLQSLDSKTEKIVEQWWQRTHGFVSLRNVHSREGVSMYVTKYITKSDMLFYAGGPMFSAYKESNSGVRKVAEGN